MAFEYRPMRSLIFVDCVREEYRHRLQHWLYAIHVPDSISKFGQYCNKYAFYNALPTPPEGERFGTRRMQLTEHYWMLNEITPEMSVNTFTERMPVEVLRWQGMIPDDDVDLSKVANMDGDEHRKSGGGDMPPFVFAHMPINWQDDYKGKGRTIADGPNYRWLFVLNFPDPEEGEKWFQEVFVPYFQNRPEVNRFVSSKIYPDVVGCKFQRAVEMWFDGPEIQSIMLGRGFIGDPALVQKAQTGTGTGRATLEAFHHDLFEGFAEWMSSRRNAMLRMKEIWFYHINLFDDHEKHVKRLRKANDVDEFLAAAAAIFRELPLREEVFPGWKK